MQDTIRLLITVTYSVEKEIAVGVPLSAIESATIDRGKISDIDAINDAYLIQIFKDNDIDPYSVSDTSWEITE